MHPKKLTIIVLVALLGLAVVRSGSPAAATNQASGVEEARSFGVQGEADLDNLPDGLAAALLAATEQARLTAADGAANDVFGISVAISDDTAVVGAWRDDDQGTDSGSAYVFQRSGTSWSQQAKLTAADGVSDAAFGYSVAISGDTVVIGANARGTDSGSAYVFQRSGTSWSQQAKLTSADGALGDRFGESVAISGDTVIVGARNDDDEGTSSGSAYIFQRSGTSWSQQAKLTAGDGAAGDRFGWSVAISGDTVVVGAYFDDDQGSNSGSAYIFQRSGTSWSKQAKLTPADGAAGDWFGESVAISGDTVIVGAMQDDDQGSASGSAYVFQRNGTSWSQQAKLTAGDGEPGETFGGSIAISGDTAIVGAERDDDKGTGSGSAYVFQRSGTSWSQQTKLTASDGAAFDFFGLSVAISGDTVVVGAPLDDDKGTDSGSAYVYALATTAPHLVLEPQTPDWSVNDEPLSPGSTIPLVPGDLLVCPVSSHTTATALSTPNECSAAVRCIQGRILYNILFNVRIILGDEEYWEGYPSFFKWEVEDIILGALEECPDLSSALHSATTIDVELDLALQEGGIRNMVVYEGLSLDIETATATVRSLGSNDFAVGYDPDAGVTPIISYLGSITVTPANPALSPFTLQTGERGEVTQDSTGPITNIYVHHVYLPAIVRN